MQKSVSQKFRKFSQNLGYPFDNISTLLDFGTTDKSLDLKWLKNAHAFEILDQAASDEQLLACSDVSNIYQFIPPYFAALSSKNGMQAISRLASYELFVGPIILDTFEEGDKLRIHVSYLKQYRKNSRFSLLVDQISLVSLLRIGTNQLIKPVSIGSKFPYGAKINHYLGITAQKSLDNYIVFRKADLLEPFVTQNDVIWEFIEPGLKKHINKLKVDQPFSAIVQNTLFRLIAGGDFRLKDTAEAIGISPRTLQRWLKKEDTTYQKQLNIVQKILALNLLQDETISTAEVSFLVGFSNVTGFYKAFKKWTGKTVLAYRHQLILEKIR